LRDGDPAAPGLTEIQTLPPVLYLDLDALVGRRAQDAPGQSTRVLSELLWSAFAHSLVDHLGSRPRLRLRPAPMGIASTSECPREANHSWHLPVHERNDLHYPWTRRCHPAERAGTLDRRGRGWHGLWLSGP